MTFEQFDEFGIVDEILPEPLGGAHQDIDATASTLKEAILRHLRNLDKLSTENLLNQRYAKYRNMGIFEEIAPPAPSPASGEGWGEA